jgi:hypothetical protein
LSQKLPLVRQLHTLLTATASRQPTLGCFGLHEWAMVYQAEENRHPWPLRLGASATDDVVREHRITCSHFDAFRFFTPPARPLNLLQPGRDDRAAFEQPGCLHAGMDLYKHAFRLSPLIGSDLIADAFELAWEIRVLDMRAAPYDFTGVILDPTGEEWTPVRIETPEGKAEYVAAQRAFAERGAPIRQRLIDECVRVECASGGYSDSLTEREDRRAVEAAAGDQVAIDPEVGAVEFDPETAVDVQGREALHGDLRDRRQVRRGGCRRDVRTRRNAPGTALRATPQPT